MQKLIDKRRQKRWLSIAWKAIAVGEKEALRHYDLNHVSTYGYKKHKEIVTQTDKRVNEVIIRVLKKLTPDIPILSEEGADIDKKDLEKTELAWVLDPIDGTTNFAARLPLWGISLALTQYGKPIIGVISLPSLKHRYHAIKGGGAWFGKERLHVSKTTNFKESFGLMCFGYLDGEIDRGLKDIAKVTKEIRSVRRLGAAVIESIWVASGRADFTVLHGAKPWDVAAGILLTTEAGGKATNTQGEPWTPKDNNLILTGPKLLPAILKTLRKK
jgi:myo-inositol-1(or 4)-monophosphatase